MLAHAPIYIYPLSIMQGQTYNTENEVLDTARKVLNKTLRSLIPAPELAQVELELVRYKNNRKGYLGDLVEQYVFGLDNNGRAEADFNIAGVELKTTPLKKSQKSGYVSKERLVFSMINYEKIVGETWETSSFLEKNKLLLILFYLYTRDESILDYEFKFTYLLNLLKDISAQDAEQIKNDWETIVAKIRRGDAHLLSEGDTYYLGACTKAKDSRVLRSQPGGSQIPAKPRAFSLKQSYLNYLIQKNLLKKEIEADSIYRGEKPELTIEEVVGDKFKDFLGLTDKEIMEKLDWQPEGDPKNVKRLIVNRILTGTGSNKIEEFEKANITLKAVTLRPSGTLEQSVSFPYFDYSNLLTQQWYDEETEEMADFHAQLESKRFLFVVFQKVIDSDQITLKKVRFWNFPMQDMEEAEKVFKLTQDCVRDGRYSDLPKISESPVAHVRPHAADNQDTVETPQHTQEVKRCFWLNAKYIQQFLAD